VKDSRRTRVLFVCLGNICRSPTAQGVLQGMVATRGLADRIAVDSCGTAHWHAGEPPDPRAVQSAAVRGYDLSPLRGRQVNAQDFYDFDYILAMDRDNLHNLEAVRPEDFKGHLGLFLEFMDESFSDEVPDPYYGGQDGFGEVLDLIEAASKGLINTLVAD
jgi:protein-tyrosine phosphatase